MSSLYTVTSANRWLSISKKPILNFLRTGVGVLSQASPTGQPLDTLHAQYPNTPITATIGGAGILPVLLLTGFSWGGTLGGVRSKPTWTWVVSKGVANSITVTLYGDNKTTPVTFIESVTGDGTLLSYQYGGTTVSGNYYRISVVATNASGSSTLSDTEYNYAILPPTVTLTSFSFLGTIGGTFAQPSWVWSYGGDPGTTYAWNVTQRDASGNNPVILASGTTSSVTSYTYNGSTVFNYYYQLNVSVTNIAGTATLFDSEGNAGDITLVITSQSIGIGTSAPVSVTVASTNAASLSFTLWQSKSTVDPGSTLSQYTSLGSYFVNPITGNDSYTRTGTTIVGRYYRWRIVGLNNGPGVANKTIFAGPSMLCTSV